MYVCMYMHANTPTSTHTYKHTHFASFPYIPQEVPYIAVTSFIFLRFFVPAILSPKLFALRDYHADQRTERTLKLIAKVSINNNNKD